VAAPLASLILAVFFTTSISLFIPPATQPLKVKASFLGKKLTHSNSDASTIPFLCAKYSSVTPTVAAKTIILRLIARLAACKYLRRSIVEFIHPFPLLILDCRERQFSQAETVPNQVFV